MPPPPNYDCPVCKKGFQRGYLAKHIATHEQKDLIEVAINKDKKDEPNWHPAYNCSDHTYYICPSMKIGHEKDTLLHKRHECQISYKEWLNYNQPIVEPSVEKNVVVEEKEPDEPINSIDMTLPEDEIIQPPSTHESLNHNEITHLKDENAKLKAEIKKKDELLLKYKTDINQKDELLLKLKNLIIGEILDAPTINVPTVNVPVVNVPTVNVPIPALLQAPKKAVKPKIHASKKEIEKGMWCVDCAACKTTAQFATDLRECCTCKKLTHFNDDLTNCYHWDCTVCSKKSCYSCVKAAGGNKIKPLCSSACADIYKSQRS